MIKNENNFVNKCQLSAMRKLVVLLNNYDFGMSISESIQSTKFIIINEFANTIVMQFSNHKDVEQDFAFDLNMGPVEEETLKKYLLKEKNFFLRYIGSQNEFVSSHLYQLYLQYLSYKLTEVEKSILLNGYIKQLTDLKGSEYSSQKRKTLEKFLKINVF